MSATFSEEINITLFRQRVYLRPSAQSADDVFPLPSSAVKPFFTVWKCRKVLKSPRFGLNFVPKWSKSGGKEALGVRH